MTDYVNCVFLFYSWLCNLFFNNSKFWDDVSWWIEKPSGLIAVAVAIIIFRKQQRDDRKKIEKEEHDRRYRTSKALLRAIEAQEKLFNNSKQTDISSEDNSIDLNIYDTSTYDSIINSGLLTHFKTDTQDCLSNLSSRVKYRNELVKGYTYTALSHVADLNGIQIDQKLQFYQISITKEEQEIQNLLKATKILLKKELS